MSSIEVFRFCNRLRNDGVNGATQAIVQAGLDNLGLELVPIGAAEELERLRREAEDLRRTLQESADNAGIWLV